MQTGTNPNTFQEQKILVVTSLANLREQLPPTFTGSTVPTEQDYPIALALGGASPFAGGAAFYAWDATSALADNNSTVIKPDSAQVGGNPGRWRMLGSTL